MNSSIASLSATSVSPIEPPSKVDILGIGLSIGSYNDQLDRMIALAQTRQSRYACFVNVHMTVETWWNEDFARIVRQADFAAPDGMPLVWSLYALSSIRQDRVAGNDAMVTAIQRASQMKLNLFLYGGKETTLERIADRIRQECPDANIVGIESPPFRALSEEEMLDTAQRINQSGAHLVLVSLGCPKQEKWMGAMKGKVNAMMMGVGGAFLLYAGEDKRAPKWMRKLCLEWCYRLALEPRRLAKRYLITNSIFLWQLFKAVLIGDRRSK